MLAIAAFLAIVIAAAIRFTLDNPRPSPGILKYIRITNDGRDKGKVGRVSYGVPSALATDGSKLYFAETVGNQFAIAQVSVTGGETNLLHPDVPNPVLLGLSPTGSELLIAGYPYLKLDSPLWVLPVPGGPAHRLGNVAGHDAGWSPSGESIVYANGSDLYIANAEGSEPRKLIATSGTPWWPRWSPDGKVLRFTVQDRKTGETALWEASASGTDLHRLFPGCCGDWTSDGNDFIFQATREGKTNIWVTREKHGLFERANVAPVQLTAGPIDFWAPVPSHDSGKIFAVGVQPRGELVRYDAKSGQFLPYLSGMSADHVEFSRDKQWICYVSYPEETVWRSRVDGSERLQLSFPPAQALLPRWSPDAKTIAFMASAPGKPWKVYVVSAAGGTPELLVADEFTETEPSWSADGKSIAFSRMPSASGYRPGTPDIRIMDLTSRRISILPGSEGLIAPRWSPDGRYLAAMVFDAERWPGAGLVLFDFATRKWSILAKESVDNKGWSWNGRYFYFDTFEGGDPAIFRVRPGDRAKERIVSLKGIRRAWGPVGWWMGLAPDDSPLVLRDISIQEIYALDWSRQKR
jgi:Tol biopolymer transport system component